MPSLSEVQAAFSAAIFDPAAAPPRGVVGPDRRPAPRRFGVYRNNVVSALGNAIAGSFPAVRRIVGEDFFRAMARAYVLAEPPISPVLLDYGTTFPDFIAGFAPAASLPYLHDVARIERLWRESYHAEEAPALAPDALASVPEDELPRIAFSLHPSLRLARSRYAALTVWRMNATDEPVTPVDISAAEDALIVRPGAEVEVRKVPPGGAAFVTALAAGETLLAAAETAQAADARFDLAGNIAGLLAAGALRDIRRA
ncbi:MAG: putative DNA-binding domain-containing protein [Bauldia sp.]|nr:putative DNA-binding domain-containing protein [Bauldia sp.]